MERVQAALAAQLERQNEKLGIELREKVVTCLKYTWSLVSELFIQFL